MGLLGRIALLGLEAHHLLPRRVLERLLGQALGDASLALCLHRVRPPGATRNGGSDMMIDAERLDELVELLCAARKQSTAEPWLTLSFDDGYKDAADYFRERRRDLPGVEWLFFVCPEKLVTRAGFRWDLQHGDRSYGKATLDDLSGENHRGDLSGLADRSDTRLLTVDECRELLDFPNVRLGNHTNCHFKHSELPLDVSRKDILESGNLFETLFGEKEHFAFPFGTPSLEFGPVHVELARQAGYSAIWSTESRPFRPPERVPGALLPRFPIFGTWPTTKTAVFILLAALRWRSRTLTRTNPSWPSSAH
jgi:hypothetical protein